MRTTARFTAAACRAVNSLRGVEKAALRLPESVSR